MSISLKIHTSAPYLICFYSSAVPQEYSSFTLQCFLAMKPNCLHVGVAFDQNYLTPFYVLATSIFQNNKTATFHFHAIATGLSELDKEAINTFISQHQSAISYYTIEPDSLAGLTVPSYLYFTIAAYYRLFFPLLLPESVDRLLYLDTDIVILGNLLELYTTDVATYPVAAVAEVRATKNRPDLGIHEIGTYFNSGVMLMNIPEWKRQNITEKALRFLRDFPEKIIFVDQDALNVVLQNNYVKLPAKFNVLPADIPKFLPKKDYATFLQNKVVMHYTLRQHKPWNRGCVSKFRYLYRSYLQQSPKAHESSYRPAPLKAQTIVSIAKVWAEEAVINLPKAAVLLSLLFDENLNGYF